MKGFFTKILLPAILVGSLLLVSCAKEADKSDNAEGSKNHTTSTPVGSNAISPDSNPNPDSEKPVICIDAGHGVGDVGTISPIQWAEGVNIYEKDINLAISLYLAEELRASGYTVVMARGNDDEIPACGYDSNGSAGIKQRVTWANAQGYDLYICVHCDSFQNDTVKGTRLYYNTGNNNAENAALSEAIAAELLLFSGSSPIIKKEADLYAVTATKMPAVLIECGFMTNREDLANLTDPSWQQPFAGAVARGIEQYLK